MDKSTFHSGYITIETLLVNNIVEANLHSTLVILQSDRGTESRGTGKSTFHSGYITML